MGCGGGPGPSCHYTLTVNTNGLPAAGGDVEVKVEAPAGCTWGFQGDVPWITVHGAPPAPSGSGNGTVVATLAANAGVRRVGTASIAFQQVTFDEAGGYNQADAEGFIKLNALRLRILAERDKKRGKNE